ncbi:hypothetical protein KDL45_15170, partial [bacterium]|nr:hypothetical protein [bacterium]
VRSLGYLSLLSPVALLGTGTIALQILLQNEPLPVRQTHMLAALLPFTFWAALRGAAWLSANIAKLRVVGTRRQKDAALGLVGVMIAASVVFHIGPQSLFGKYQNYGRDRFERYGDATHVLAKSFRTPTPAERDAVQALDAIDQDAFVIANSRLLLLLSNRRRLGEFGNQIDLNGFDEAQYIALWFLEAECRTCTYAHLSPESLDLAAELVTSGRFTATHATDAFALLTAVRESAMRPTPENERYLARLADLKGRLERDEGLPPDIPDGV